MIDKTCEHCGKHYRVPPARAKSRFCSKGCYDVVQATSERRPIKCEHCGTTFTAKKDHGAWPRFCCRGCFRLQKGSPAVQQKECANCGGIFDAGRSTTAAHSEDGYRIFCSVKCRAEGTRTREERSCANCGGLYTVTPSNKQYRPEGGCCSYACATAYYVGERARGWKGGQFYSKTAGHGFTHLVRPDYTSKYIQEHRLVVSKALGRLVERGEVVIHINRNKTDNRLENLFLCGSISEFARRRQGSLPWPTTSNITKEKAAHADH